MRSGGNDLFGTSTFRTITAPHSGQAEEPAETEAAEIEAVGIETVETEAVEIEAVVSVVKGLQRAEMWCSICGS